MDGLQRRVLDIPQMLCHTAKARKRMFPVKLRSMQKNPLYYGLCQHDFCQVKDADHLEPMLL